MIDFPKPVPFVYASGDHRPRTCHVEVFGKPKWIPINPFQWFLELGAVGYWDANSYLRNSRSFSCSRQSWDGRRPFDETARDRARHLRKRITTEGVDTGSESYRLNLALGTVVIARRVLDIPGLDKRIVDKVREAFDHALATDPTVRPRYAALFLEMSGASVREYGR